MRLGVLFHFLGNLSLPPCLLIFGLLLLFLLGLPFLGLSLFPFLLFRLIAL
jgi:hypothetical protein